MFRMILVLILGLCSAQALATDKSTAKCIGGPAGSKGGCFTLPIVDPPQACLMQIFEQTKETVFETESGEEVSLLPGSGLVTVYDWKSKKQYVYGDSGTRTELSKSGQCTTESKPKRSLNGLLSDVASAAVEKVRPQFMCKKLGGCGEDKPMLAIASACKDYLKTFSKAGAAASGGEEKK